MTLRTKTGRLTAYAFACGYMERKFDATTGRRTDLYSQHGVYFVRGVDNDPDDGVSVRFDVGFLTIKEARMRFDSAKGEIE